MATTLASKGGEATALIVTTLLQLIDAAGEAYLKAHQDLESEGTQPNIALDPS